MLVTVPAHGRPRAHRDRPRRRRRRRRGPLRRADRGARSGARVALVSATPLARTASYWAQGGLAAALAADDSPDLHREDTERAGRDLVRTQRRDRRCAARRRAPSATSSASACTSTPTATATSRSASRAATRAGASSTPAAARPAGASCASSPPSSSRQPGVTVIEGARAAALWVRDGRCVGVVCEDGRAIHARAVILATGGSAALWQRTTNPPGLAGHRAAARPRRRRGARRPRAHAVPPDRGDRHQGPRGLPGHRGDPRRGRHAARRRRRALRRGARAARRGGARDLVDRCARAGAPSVDLDMRAVDPALFPNVVGALREAGLDPATELRPGGARPRTTAWAASSPTSTARRRCPASTRSARARAPACTAPTAWPPTR